MRIRSRFLLKYLTRFDILVATTIGVFVGTYTFRPGIQRAVHRARQQKEDQQPHTPLDKQRQTSLDD